MRMPLLRMHLKPQAMPLLLQVMLPLLQVTRLLLRLTLQRQLLLKVQRLPKVPLLLKHRSSNYC